RRPSAGQVQGQRPEPPVVEVALQLGRGRQRRADRVHVLTDDLPLLSAKEEQLVLLDRAAQVPAEVVEPELLLLLLSVAHSREETPRLALGLPQESQNPADELVAAAASDNVNGSPGVAPVFGGEV